jgi:hypothetical protein
MLKSTSDNCRHGLLGAILLLIFAWNTPQALGQSGIILPDLADRPGILPDLNSDLTETAGTDTPNATASIGFNLAGAPIVPQPGGAGGIENVTNLVNNVTAGDPADNVAKWLDFQGDDMMMPVHIELGTTATANYYTLTSANDAPDRDPWKWRLLGTNVATPTAVTDFVVLDSREGVTFTARDQTQLFSFTNTTSYKTYRFEFETHEVAVPGTPVAANYDSMQLAEIELFNNFTFAGPVLTINRTSGNISLQNGGASTLNMTGYSITSAKGTLNSTGWLSIANNYDGDSGGGSAIDTDNWIRLTSPTSRKDLSEVENPNGSNGVPLAAAQTINFGTAWFKYPVEDILGEILLADGTTQAVTVSYVGGAPYVFGDLNFSGGATPLTFADWVAFKTGQGFNFATAFSPAESYSHGDLDGDLDFDIDDFKIFKTTYDLANGAGAFDAMLASVPEPATAVLLAMTVLFAASVHSRRRLQILAVAGIMIALIGGEATRAGEVLPGLIGSDLTNPDNAGAPDVTITAGDSANSPLAEGPANLLDNAVATKWLAFQPNGTFYQVQFNGGAQHAVNTYTLTSANDAPERDPYRWTLSGSNNGVNFTVVDQQSAQRFTARGQTQQFLVANTQAYNYYRFDFLTPLGAGALNPGAPNSIQIGELELFNDPDPDILTLEVNTQTGSIRLANNSDDTIPFDAYRIKSPTGALNFANWSGGPAISNNGGQSIHDLNLPGFPRGNGTGNGWEEGLAGSSNFDLMEFYLGAGGVGSSSLGTEQGITMNNVFQTAGAHDVTFEYHSNGQTVRGFVEYVGAPMGVPGDYNGNGVVDGPDYVLWRNGGPLQNEVDAPGTVNAADYTAWRARFGNTSGSGSLGGSAVPEPASCMLALSIPALLLFVRRQPRMSAAANAGPYDTSPSRSRRCTMIGGTRKSHFIMSVVAALACVFSVNTARASTVDRDYQLQGNGNDGAGSADNLTENGSPTYVDVQALGRPGATAGALGVQLTATSSQYLNGFGLGSPPEGAPIGLTYPLNRWMEVWARPTLNNATRQEVVSDTFQFGLFVGANGNWGQTYGSGAAPANLGDDFATTVPVAFNQWTHIMQRTITNTGVALYINGVAVSRFNAGYTASTVAVTPTPDRNMYVGAGSGGTTNFFTGQVDSLKLGVYGDNTAGGGQNWGNFDLAVDNDYIAFALPNMGFVNGDVNGDGVVNGTGSGPAATDDVRFFIDHWLAERRVNNFLIGDLTSRTTLGDLNFDGRTSLADWNILRNAHVGGAGLDLDALLAGVPEPSTAAIAALAALLVSGLARKRRESV